MRKIMLLLTFTVAVSCSRNSEILMAEEDYQFDHVDTITFKDRGEETTYIIDSMPFVRSPLVAVKIARAIIRNQYGDECAKEMPYNVTLLLDENLWQVRGSVKDGEKGGAFVITISKMDGHIIGLFHEK